MVPHFHVPHFHVPHFHSPRQFMRYYSMLSIFLEVNIVWCCVVGKLIVVDINYLNTVLLQVRNVLKYVLIEVPRNDTVATFANFCTCSWVYRV